MAGRALSSTVVAVEAVVVDGSATEATCGDVADPDDPPLQPAVITRTPKTPAAAAKRVGRRLTTVNLVMRR